ncbi:heme biosynthesis HemY N-terminal domain-containing protein [Ottowia sp.]|jgi:HemY protein|uniref:heme biosynthesis protein HemY n=1 Tax=Ottowia sp. TaxID=1898956 RepID=UPI0025FA16DC|nr:heme biosynthesis HemY N-terminal domain-containing protein [Ottowia sp.]MBK6613263.1 heme biosynthesis protein HemY [Ottowia sp.]MBK6747630.1 heme biosynthesis protein HemY [Ottowia sp.]
MRAALWLMGLFAGAVALALFTGDNDGTVTVFWPPHRVDLSVNLVLLLLAGLFALLYATLRTLAALFELPRQARRWRAQQRERATHALLLDALAQFMAGRYLRARKAAESAVAREQVLAESGEAPPHTVALRALAHLTVAESAHALQDQATRDAHLAHALDAAALAGAPAELREGALLRAARWALNERDPAAALARLDELPTGANRRTAALRLKLKAARQSGRIAEAMDTARLLAKHRAFSPQAARSLIRGLAADQIAGAHDAVQLRQAWAELDPRERAMPELALRAAQRLLALGGDAALVRQWLLPVWDEMLALPESFLDTHRARLVRVLEVVMAATGDPSDQEWLARIEAAQQAHPGDATLQYLAGMACLRRGLWGRAQLLLGQAARALEDDGLRRNAWRALAGLAEQRGDEAAAGEAWRRAAA